MDICTCKQFRVNWDSRTEQFSINYKELGIYINKPHIRYFCNYCNKLNGLAFYQNFYNAQIIVQWAWTSKDKIKYYE